MEVIYLTSRKAPNTKKNMKTISLLTILATILVITLNHRNNPGPKYSSPSITSSSAVLSNNPAANDVLISDVEEQCDIFVGEGIQNPDAPYYTNRTCWAIHEHQNCMKYGRPGSEFMKWRWQPDGCDLQVLNPFQFLDIVRDKKLAFVGDSVGKDQMQSMLCLLSKAEYPVDISPPGKEHSKHWKYVNYNFTISYFWSPFLVRSSKRDLDGPTNTDLFNLYLDEFDESWSSQIDGYDYVIINAGHWFSRTAVYYENRRIVGCRSCQLPKITDLPQSYGYRRAFRTAFEALNERRDFNGVIFLRTYAPSHFENGLWNAGENCAGRRPFRSNETGLDGVSLDMYLTQLEEFRAAEKEGKKRFRRLDTTRAMC